MNSLSYTLRHNKKLVRGGLFFILFISFFGLFFISYEVLFFSMTDFTNNSPIGIKKKKLNVSIGFYVMVDSNDSPQPDLRTRFWEPQLKDATGDISRYYLSEGIYTVNGIEFTILPEGTASINDSNKCVRFSQSWVHFMRYHKKTKWYFRAETETYINVTNLGNFMIDREKELDPLRKPHMNFNVVASSNSLYPSLISGVLISNHAVKSQ